MVESGFISTASRACGRPDCFGMDLWEVMVAVVPGSAQEMVVSVPDLETDISFEYGSGGNSVWVRPT